MAPLGFTPTAPSLAHLILLTSSPTEKVSLTCQAQALPRAPPPPPPYPTPPDHPARPARPLIIPANEIPSHRHSHAPHNVYLLHALAHVELNAVDLALDTMLRFIPEREEEREEWCEDWVSIAGDEAKHYTWLTQRLEALGWKYGDLPAHGIIWKAAKDSEQCVVTRLALGQLVAEARGLDASPRLAKKLVGMGDKLSADVVATIAEEEVRHVQIGVKWYTRYAGDDAVERFQRIAMEYANAGSFDGGFNKEKRLEAGLGPHWYEPVAEMMKERRVKERERRKKEEEDRERKQREQTILRQQQMRREVNEFVEDMEIQGL